jgi:EAL domain-containing protein (putative c-di-GMP-specific phosphodiesterase class I)
MHRPFEIDGRDFTLTSSIGIAVYPADGTDAQTLLKHADSAMYHAKRLGRDNSQLYSASFTRQAMDRLDLDNGLRGALGRDEFHLLYQPVVDLSSGRMISVEALVRWQHPVRGLIPPSMFIPIAEENGVISAIGQWVLEKACADLSDWQRSGLALRLAINISPRQFGRTDLVSSVLDTLHRNGLVPEQLELEITEGAVIEKFVATVAALHAFRDHGVRIAMDDFGTGYSSLSYLRQIPIDIIKIDRSFVGRLTEGGRSASIVEAILALARAFGVSVTAEGVETPEQARALIAMSCQNAQGYYFSRPVPAEQIAQLASRDWRIAELAGDAPEQALVDGN